MKVHLWVLTVFSAFILAGVGYDLILLHQNPKIEVHEKITIVREKQVYYERLEINQRIQEIQAYEDYDKVIALYGKIAGDRSIAVLILNNALVKKVPVNMAFALCKQESNFISRAVSKNIKEGKVLSRDYGLFQLNSQVYRTLLKDRGVEWVLLPENNVEIGLRHLQELYFRHGESWDRSVIRYNGRYTKGADEHLVGVYRYERQYDKLFNGL